jgi:hypothetical protein
MAMIQCNLRRLRKNRIFPGKIQNKITGDRTQRSRGLQAEPSPVHFEIVKYQQFGDSEVPLKVKMENPALQSQVVQFVLRTVGATISSKSNAPLSASLLLSGAQLSAETSEREQSEQSRM